MRITFNLTTEDYYDAAQARNKRNRRISGVVALATAFVIIALWIRGPDVESGHKYLSLGLFLIMFFGIFPASKWIEKYSFRHALKNAEYNQNKELTIDISDTGIQSLDSPQREDWSRFSKYSETVSSFILYQADSIHAIFPKRAFDPESINSFRRILDAKLPKH